MQDGTDWLLRPVMNGMCKFESLFDGTIDLWGIAVMNEKLDVDAANQFLYDEAHSNE